MKKYIILITSLLITVCLLFSCADHSLSEKAPNNDVNNDSVINNIELLDGEFITSSIDVTILDDKNTPSTLTPDISVAWGTYPKEFESPPQKQLQISYNQKVYEGTYVNSHVAYRNDYITHVYEFTYETLETFTASDGSVQEYTEEYIGEFSINATTNELIGINYGRPPRDYGVSEEQCAAIANTAASEFVDTNNFQLEIKESGRLYHFKYQKYYLGINTTEYITVTVDKAGTIHSISGTMYNRFPIDDNQADATASLNLLSANAKAAVQARALYAGNGKYDQAEVGEALWSMVNGEVKLVYQVGLSSSKEHSHTNIYVAIEAAPEAELQTQTE